MKLSCPYPIEQIERLEWKGMIVLLFQCYGIWNKMIWLSYYEVSVNYWYERDIHGDCPGITNIKLLGVSKRGLMFIWTMLNLGVRRQSPCHAPSIRGAIVLLIYVVLTFEKTEKAWGELRDAWLGVFSHRLCLKGMETLLGWRKIWIKDWSLWTTTPFYAKRPERATTALVGIA